MAALSLTLSQHTRLSKTELAADYVIESQSPISIAVEQMAYQWLQVQLHSENELTCVCCRLGKDWWIFRLAPSQTLDAQGRQLAHATLAQVSAKLQLKQIPELLFSMASLELIDGQHLPLEMIPITIKEKAFAEIISPLVQGLQNPEAPFKCAALETAKGMMALFEETDFDWVALMPQSIVNHLPQGKGMVISAYYENKIPVCSEDLAKLDWNQAGEFSSLSLLERLKLVLGLLPRPTISLDISALIWFLPLLPRQTVLEWVADEQISSWLKSEQALPDDLLILKSRLNQGHLDAVVSLLKQCPEGWQNLLDIFPDAIASALSILPESLTLLWERLLSGEDIHPSESERILLTKILQTPLATAIPIPQLQNLFGRGIPGAEQLWREKCKHLGLTGAFLDYLEGKEHQAPASPPTISPETSWVSLFPSDPFKRLFNNHHQDPGWQFWLTELFMVLYHQGQLDNQEILDWLMALPNPTLYSFLKIPEEVSTLLNASEPVLCCPPKVWHPLGSTLLNKRWAEGRLWSLLKGPLTKTGFYWLISQLPVLRETPIYDGLITLYEGPQKSLAREQIQPVWDLLERQVVLQQIVIQAQMPLDASASLRTWLTHPALTLQERSWLSEMLLHLQPIGYPPLWSALDFTLLLPLIDPVRDIIRVIFSRPDRDPYEPQLLQALLQDPRLTFAHPPPLPTLVQEQWRPDWVAALGKIWPTFQERTLPKRLGELQNLILNINQDAEIHHYTEIKFYLEKLEQLLNHV